MTPSDSECHHPLSPKAAVGKRRAQLGRTPCPLMRPLRVVWVEQAREEIKPCGVEGAAFSCGSKGEPEWRSRRLPRRLGEAYLEAALGQGPLVRGKLSLHHRLEL
jgi:hypothetical protein